jgi:hypothetical protein
MRGLAFVQQGWWYIVFITVWKAVDALRVLQIAEQTNV